MSSVTLHNLSKTFARNIVAIRDLNLHVPDGTLAVILGPSGCGKTTALRLIAGLETPATGGKVLLDDRNVTHLVPAKRNISMVFQNAAVYPHLSVRSNLAFGLRQRRISKDDIERRVSEAATLWHIDSLLDRSADVLSGGERQRVALARAVITQPAVCLLDEPLANLDAPLRARLQTEIRSLQSRLRMTMIAVTHDQQEAMAMADLLVLMTRGSIQQIGEPAAVYDRPANRFVAGFFGTPPMNFIDGSVATDRNNLLFRTRDGACISLGSADRFAALDNGQSAALGFRPGAVQIARAVGSAKSHAHIQAIIHRITNCGEHLIAEVRLASGQFISMRLERTAAYMPGEDVELILNGRDFHLFGPGEFGASLASQPGAA